MVASAVSAMLLAAILTSVIYFSRTSLSMASYYEMGNAKRTLLHYFGRDVRESSKAQWTSPNQLQLNVDGDEVTYRYDSLDGTFERSVPGEGARVLAENLRKVQFLAFDVNGNELLLSQDLSLASEEAKKIQIGLDFESTEGPVSSTETILSSKYMLRNKSVEAP